MTEIEQASGADFSAAVQALATSAEGHDGVAPFNEATLLDPAARHAIAAIDEGSVIGLALAADTDDGGLDAELVVAPGHRGHGIGRQLLDALGTRAGDRSLSVWAHGDLPPAAALAAAVGLQRDRVLALLRRPLSDADLRTPPAPNIRAFDPATDAEAWLALNARVFADHPEQGKLTRADLDHRMRQPWFNADDFLVIAEAGELIGFNWLKITPDEAEVYVVGVDARRSGEGLGRTLMQAGLRRLRERGAQEAVLYVDGDNEPAMTLYRTLGFEPAAIDVQYRR